MSRDKPIFSRLIFFSAQDSYRILIPLVFGFLFSCGKGPSETQNKNYIIHKYEIYDTFGNQLYTFGTWSQLMDDPSMLPNVIKSVHHRRSSVNPVLKKYVLGGRFRDFIEILDLSSGKLFLPLVRSKLFQRWSSITQLVIPWHRLPIEAFLTIIWTLWREMNIFMHCILGNLRIYIIKMANCQKKSLFSITMASW